MAQLINDDALVLDLPEELDEEQRSPHPLFTAAVITEDMERLSPHSIFAKSSRLHQPMLLQVVATKRQLGQDAEPMYRVWEIKLGCISTLV